MNTKHSVRKCAGCNNIFDRAGLIKITSEHASKKLYLNPDTRTFGRSVYLCKHEECLKKALKKDRLFKLLRVKRDEELISALQSLFVGQ